MWLPDVSIFFPYLLFWTGKCLVTRRRHTSSGPLSDWRLLAVKLHKGQKRPHFFEGHNTCDRPRRVSLETPGGHTQCKQTNQNKPLWPACMQRHLACARLKFFFSASFSWQALSSLSWQNRIFFSKNQDLQHACTPHKNEKKNLKKTRSEHAIYCLLCWFWRCLSLKSWIFF